MLNESLEVVERAARTVLGNARRKFSAGIWLPVIRRIPGSVDQVGLSFDDGPTYATTPALIATLREFRATATFFLTGERVMKAPDLLEALVDAGHDVFVHGWRHIHYDAVDARVLIDDLDRAEQLLSRVRPTPSPYLVRLPYGAGHATPRIHRALRAWKPDAQIAHWDDCNEDWTLADGCRDEQELHANCVFAAKREVGRSNVAGSILVLHEDPYDALPPLSKRIAPVYLPVLLSEMMRGALYGCRLLALEASPEIRRYIRG